jgi:hypothetical protein
MPTPSIRERVKHLLRMCGHAFFSTLHERLDALERQTRNAAFPETQAALLQASIHTVEKLHELTDHVVVETDDYKSLNPEIGLMEFLYSYLPTRQAVLTGATDSRFAEYLRAAGYELSTSDTIREDAGLVMLDSARVVHCPVAVVKLPSDVNEMRAHGYHWYIVLHRDSGGRIGFYANRPPASLGSVFFFREYATFWHAQAWCAAVLPRTYFKPASLKNSTTESIPRS